MLFQGGTSTVSAENEINWSIKSWKLAIELHQNPSEIEVIAKYDQISVFCTPVCI
jgi:hypothetical protein